MSGNRRVEGLRGERLRSLRVEGVVARHGTSWHVVASQVQT